jgi:hypothetical protein
MSGASAFEISRSRSAITGAFGLRKPRDDSGHVAA